MHIPQSYSTDALPANFQAHPGGATFRAHVLSPGGTIDHSAVARVVESIDDMAQVIEVQLSFDSMRLTWHPDCDSWYSENGSAYNIRPE